MRGNPPDQPPLDAGLARAQPRPLPAVGHVRDNWGPNVRGEYIGRACFGWQQSTWANPYKIGRDGDRKTVIAKYEVYARERLARQPDWLEPLRDAEILWCWCRRRGETGPACHGDVIVRLLQGEGDAARPG